MLIRVHLLSTDTSLLGTLRQALRPDAVTAFATAPEALNHLLLNRHASGNLLLVDLATTVDIERFLFFLASTPLRNVPVVTIGAADHYKSLSREVLDTILVTIRTPENATDLAIVVATLRAVLTDPKKYLEPKGRWG
jgi:hypothetical protein